MRRSAILAAGLWALAGNGGGRVAWKINHDLRETLRAFAHERIEFHLDSYDVHISAATPTARLTGRLRVAGTERPLMITATVDCDTLGNMRMRGTHILRMTDFAVVPPRQFGGLLRVHDHITVHFDILPGASAGVADVAHRTLGEPGVPYYPGGRYAAEF